MHGDVDVSFLCLWFRHRSRCLGFGNGKGFHDTSELLGILVDQKHSMRGIHSSSRSDDYESPRAVLIDLSRCKAMVALNMILHRGG